MSDHEDAPAPEFTELSARHLGPVRRFLVRHPVAMDLLLIGGFAAWALLTGAGADSMYALHAYLGGDRVLQMQRASLALTAAGAVALGWRRRRPLLVAAATAVLGVAALATTGATSGFEVGLAIALYAVAASRRPPVTWTTLAATVAALLAAAQLFPLPAAVGARMLGLDPAGSAAQAADGGVFVQNAVWMQTVAAPVLVLALLAVAAGTSVRNRRLHVASFLDAANALARDQDQRARLAQAAERARIAREMHDIVAHSVSVMVTLAGGASAAMDRAPAQSRVALDELVVTGRSALDDMRRVLGVLHEADGPAGGTPVAATDPAPLDPQPGSGDLPALVDRFRTAGLPVSATGLGDHVLAGLDASVQLAVYRIVQEALTNVLRHAQGTAAVEVAVRLDRARVEVVVVDHGVSITAGPGPGAGRGLVGMRERAAAFGGTVEAGPSGPGWRVRAVIPARGRTA